MTQEFVSSRGRTLLLAVLAAMMGFGGWFVPVSADDSIRYQTLWPLAHWVAAPLMALAAVLLVAQAIFPVTLRLDEEGFAVLGGLTGGYRVAWRDVESFELWGGRRGPDSADGVSWTFRPGVQPKKLLLSLSARPALPSFLKMEPKDLLEIMNRALETSRR